MDKQAPESKDTLTHYRKYKTTILACNKRYRENPENLEKKPRVPQQISTQTN